MSSLTRGPLPPRVYWRRRLLVLGVALLLVVGLGRLLSGGSDGSSTEDRASRAAAETSGSPSATTTSAAPEQTDVPSAGPTRKGTPKFRPTPVQTYVAPEGTCADEDVVVTPGVEGAVAGQDVAIVLSLHTRTTPACLWQVSPGRVTMKIDSGRDSIWSSRECPAVVPTQDLVLRNDTDAAVTVTWNAKRSDEDCSSRTEWANPGWYFVYAAALSGEPARDQFELTLPVAETVTQTVEPTPAPTPRAGVAGGGSGSGDGTRGPTPSGAVEPVR